MKPKGIYLYFLCYVRRPLPLYSVVSTIQRFDVDFIVREPNVKHSYETRIDALLQSLSRRLSAWFSSSQIISQ